MGHGTGISGRRRASRTRQAISIAGATALALSLLGATTGVSAAEPTPRETVAALDPALTEARGATVDFVEQEAENAATNGSAIGFDTTAYTLAAEASGRRAVKLTSPGDYVEFTLTRPANAISVRYSIPDAATGGGIDAPITLTANGKRSRTLTLTSKYSWLYNQYSFSNDPNAGPIHPDWWITERDAWFGTGITIPFRPMHFYDEQRVLLGHDYQAGDTIRLTVPQGSNAAWYVIDLMDFEQVAPPQRTPRNSVSVLAFGADPTGKRESSDAFDAAITAAKAKGRIVFVPAGTYQVNRHIVVDDVTIQGAGNWWTIIRGQQVTLDEPQPDGSIHTGVGFYGKYAEDGGSSNVHLADFAIEGDVRERIDTDQVNGVGGALSDSTIEGLYIHHTKVGLWFDGPMDNLSVRDTIVVDVIADAVNFRRGVTNSEIVNSFFRNTGDDAMAMWSHNVSTVAIDENRNNLYDHNTIQTPTLANGIAIYGGRDNTVSNNLVADPIREGSGLHAGQRFNSTPFAGYLRFTNNTTVRAGTFELNWNIGLGAIWLFALEGSLTADIEVTGDHYLHNTYNAIMLVADWPVKDLYSIENVSFKDVRIDGTGTSVMSARAMGSASFENVDARNVGAPVPWGDDRELFVNNCGAFNWDWENGSEFSMIDLGGNDYFGDPTQTTWLPAWLMPNLITCDDRPPVNPPPPPSAW